REIEGNVDHRELPLVVDRKRGMGVLKSRKSAQWHRAAAARLHEQVIQILRALVKIGRHFEHNSVLVELSENRRDLPLAEGVVQGVVEGLGGDAKAPCRVAIEYQMRAQT